MNYPLLIDLGVLTPNLGIRLLILSLSVEASRCKVPLHISVLSKGNVPLHIEAD